MGSSSNGKDGGKTVRNSPTLVGAAAGTAGGPVWALLGSGLANALAGFPETDWGTVNTSAALLLVVVNAAVLVMGLVVASRCVASGRPGSSEFAAAALLTVPYVVYRAFYPCAPPRSAGVLGGIEDIGRGMAPVVLYQMGGFKRAAAAAKAASATAAAVDAAASSLSAFGGGGGRRI
jgi:hypothetical protein